MSNEVGRRTVLKSSLALGVGLTTLPTISQGEDAADPGSAMSVRTQLTVNGAQQVLDADPRTTLLDALREHLNLTGTKKGCDHGQCGACTVLVNGRRINSCLTLLAMHEGDEVATIESLGTPDDLHPMQEAFLRRDALQCGYCTPGQIMSLIAMLAELQAQVPSHVTADLAQVVYSVEEIRERMSIKGVGELGGCGTGAAIANAVFNATGVRIREFPITLDKILHEMS